MKGQRFSTLLLICVSSRHKGASHPFAHCFPEDSHVIAAPPCSVPEGHNCTGKKSASSPDDSESNSLENSHMFTVFRIYPWACLHQNVFTTCLLANRERDGLPKKSKMTHNREPGNMGSQADPIPRGKAQESICRLQLSVLPYPLFS